MGRSCRCGATHAVAALCPEDRRDIFEELDVTLLADLPLSPNAQGITVDKFDVIEMVELLARKLHLPLVGQDSRKAYGGHVFRVSGARHLAKIGIAIPVIKTGIVDKKPETCESIEVAQQKKKRRTETLAFLLVAIEEAAAHAGVAEAAAEAAHDEIQAFKDRLFALETQSFYMPELGVNDSGLGAVHRNLSALAPETPDLWRTACGRRYGKARI